MAEPIVLSLEDVQRSPRTTSAVGRRRGRAQTDEGSIHASMAISGHKQAQSGHVRYH